jgi:hypothetical protein
MEDDIQKRADNKSWDQKQDQWISDANRKIEHGVRGDALAALHGLHVPAEEAPPRDDDRVNETDDEGTLHDKIITGLVDITQTILQKDHLPDDAKQKWTSMLQECSPRDPSSVTLLRQLRGELDSWEEIDPQSELSLVYSAITALTTTIEGYQRRFTTR